MSTNAKLSYDIYFSATPEAVWKALTDGDATERYFFGTRFDARLERGAPLAYRAGDAVLVEGEILDVTPGKRLVARQRSLWDEKVARDGASRVTWELTAVGPKATRLTLVHDELAGKDETYKQSADGWPLILSSMKTLVETGSALEIPQA